MQNPGRIAGLGSAPPSHPQTFPSSILPTHRQGWAPRARAARSAREAASERAAPFCGSGRFLHPLNGVETGTEERDKGALLSSYSEPFDTPEFGSHFFNENWIFFIFIFSSQTVRRVGRNLPCLISSLLLLSGKRSFHLAPYARNKFLSEQDRPRTRKMTLLCAWEEGKSCALKR